MKPVKTNSTKTTTNHNIIAVQDAIIENGVNYGSPNVKAIRTITAYENNDYVAEEYFYINGYKFRMDDLMRHSIKRYLLAEAPCYRNIKEIDKVLSERVNFKMGSDAPQYLKIRAKQLTTFIRGLLKVLSKSTQLREDIDCIFGVTQWDKIISHNDFNGEIMFNWKNEWKRDYTTPKYKLA